MPAQPAWFHRLDEILVLRPMTSTHLDRAAVEKLFRVRERSTSRTCYIWGSRESSKYQVADNIGRHTCRLILLQQCQRVRVL